MAEKKTVSKTFVWRIGNFARESIKQFQVGKVLESPIFCVLIGDEVTKWKIRLYPNGTNANNINFIGVYLENVNFAHLISKSDLQILYNVGIQRQYGRKDYIKTGGDLSKLEQCNYPPEHDKFMSHDELFDPVNAFIIDAKLTLFSKIEIINSIENLKDTQAPMMKTCLPDYKQFFNDELYADFELEMSDNKTLKAHKTILAARSPVFYAMLKPQTKEAEENHVDIPDFDSNIMKEILRFMYYFEVENLDAVAADLIHAAEKYELTELKEMCLNSLVSTISAENVIHSLIIADLLSGTEKLYDKCLEVIISNYIKVKESDGWKNLSKDLKFRVLEQMFEVSNEHVISTSSAI